jgi:hypothetical protein
VADVPAASMPRTAAPPSIAAAGRAARAFSVISARTLATSPCTSERRFSVSVCSSSPVELSAGSGRPVAGEPGVTAVDPVVGAAVGSVVTGCPLLGGVPPRVPAPPRTHVPLTRQPEVNLSAIRSPLGRAPVHLTTAGHRSRFRFPPAVLLWLRDGG